MLISGDEQQEYPPLSSSQLLFPALLSELPVMLDLLALLQIVPCPTFVGESAQPLSLECFGCGAALDSVSSSLMPVLESAMERLLAATCVPWALATWTSVPRWQGHGYSTLQPGSLAPPWEPQ